MRELERRPTELLVASDNLRKLIIENPGLPLLVFAGDDCNSGDYSYMTCSSCWAEVGEFLDCIMNPIGEKLSFSMSITESYGRLFQDLQW